MAKYDHVFINKSGLKIYLSFKGFSDFNKWADPDGKVYLTEEEYDFLKHRSPQLFEKKKLVKEEDVEAKVENVKDEEKHAEFFDQHVNKAKAQASKMENLDEINQLLQYADENEINNKAVDALISRANELGE